VLTEDIKTKFSWVRINRWVLQEDITVCVKICEANPERTKRKKQIYCVRDFNILPGVTDRSIRQKSSKNRVDLNSIINQLDLSDFYRILHPPIEEYTFFWSNWHGTFTKRDYILSHYIHLNKFKITIIQSQFSDHNGIKLEINNRRIFGNSPRSQWHTFK
jgi:exonuclease III